MVNRYAVIRDGVVENVLKLDESLVPTWFEADPTRELVPADKAGPGDTFVDGVFTKVPTPYDYRAEREKNYLPLKDQLDMLWHDFEDGTTTWRDHVRAVKQAYPKP
jgi:hypothetical protein